MTMLKAYLHFIRNLIVRRRVDKARRTLGLRTPLDTVISILKSKNLLPHSIRALEPFGMYGLWVTKDYADLCESLEFWELDPTYAKFAKAVLRSSRVSVNTGDSIEACKIAYKNAPFNFIVIDNPARSFGPYCEHFDLWPNILKYADSQCSIILNVCVAPQDYCAKFSEEPMPKEWKLRRKHFYGSHVDEESSQLEVNDAIKFYHQSLPNGFVVRETFFIPRNEMIGFLVLTVERRQI